MNGDQTDRFYRVIKRPHVTEKTSDAMAIRNAYTFRVPVDANKVEVRQAVQSLFGVKVLSVNTSQVRGKPRRRGWIGGSTPNWKKATVQLQEGQSIDVV